MNRDTTADGAMVEPSAIVNQSRCPEMAAEQAGYGADDGIRTRDPHLGKVMLYQLSHVRVSGGLRYQSPAEIDNGTSTGTALVRTSITIAPSAASTTKAPATCRMLSR